MARLSMIRQGGQGGNDDVEAGSPADEHDSRVQSLGLSQIFAIFFLNIWGVVEVTNIREYSGSLRSGLWGVVQVTNIREYSGSLRAGRY